MLIKRKSIEKESSMHPSRRRGAAVPRKAELPRAVISEHDGVRNLHLGTEEFIQGAMRVCTPDAIELEYTQQMMLWLLFNREPQHIVQLGLGAAALTKFCYRQFPKARVTAIELNPAVIEICQAQFHLPPNDARLNVIEMNALDFVTHPAHHNSIDILQVDLYDAEARGPVLDTPAFYQACAHCLTPEGMMTVNLYGQQPNHATSLQAMQQAFDAVVWLPEVHDANVVVLAFKHAPVMDFSVLDERALVIKAAMNLPAENWVDGLKTWMRDE